LTGIGSGAFNEVSRNNRSVHNSFLSVLAETGVIGLVLLFGVLLTVVDGVRRLPRQEAFFWLTFISVWGVGNLALTWVQTKSTWLFLNMAVISASIHLYSVRKQAVNRKPAVRVERRTRQPEPHPQAY
jgi:O-antigen ligase